MSDAAVPTPEQLKQLEGSSGFIRAVGMTLAEVSGSRVVGHIDLGPQHHQPMGIVHGGVYCAAIESAASVGAYAAVMGDGRAAVGVHNSTNFLASMSEGRVEVVATPITQGRTQQLWQVDITRVEDGRLIATGQVRLQNITPR